MSLIPETCIYCGSAPGASRDHAIPKSLLGDGRYRPNLRTVPACGPCNRFFSRDEEYLRRVIVTFFAHTPEGDALYDGAVGRSFDRSSAIEGAVWGILGADAGQPCAELDTASLNRVAGKIVRGLSYLRSGYALPPDAVFAFAWYEPEQRPAPLASLLSAAAVDTDDAPNFTFQVVDGPDPAHAQLWELVFFGGFCCAVGVRRADP
jgi:hypothetical protein